MIPSYDSIRTGFRESLARLSSPTAYEAIQAAAVHLLSSSGLRGERDRRLFEAVADAFSAYARRDLVEARRLADAVLAADGSLDQWSLVDAEHVVARTQYDQKELVAAEATLLRVLARSQTLGYSDGFVRALHEISRVKAQNYEPLDAEAGYRVALEYYTLRWLASGGSSGGGPSHDSDRRNVDAALGGLSALSESYFLLAGGPTEGSRLLQALQSDFFGDDLTGDDFLEVRGLALRLLTGKALEAHAANLIGRAMALLPTHRPLSMYAFDEAAWHGARRGISYPERLRTIYARSSDAALRDASFFKPTGLVQTTQPPLRHVSPDDAAPSIDALYKYLAPLDQEGRYVYRGQVKEYDAPLLPSAFRGILTESHGAAVLPLSSFPSANRLRGSGERFVGDYNYCFTNYADARRLDSARGMDPTAQDELVRVYEKLLNDQSVILDQGSIEGFVSWAEAVDKRLSDSERELYRANAAEWDVRRNNYHKRTFRNELLVRLFGYTLGTTFAQQYEMAIPGSLTI